MTFLIKRPCKDCERVDERGRTVKDTKDTIHDRIGNNNIHTFFSNELELQLGVYTIRFGWFWRGYLHHAYWVQFHPMLDRTSLLEGKNQSTQGVVNFSSSTQFVQLYGLDF